MNNQTTIDVSPGHCDTQYRVIVSRHETACHLIIDINLAFECPIHRMHVPIGLEMG
jgi:hypothetical protein